MAAISAVINGLRSEWFVVTLAIALLTATFLPCYGVSAIVFHYIGLFAIASLFFLQGARLSRQAVRGGITHWRLHVTITTITFVVYPLIGLLLSDSLSHLLPTTLWAGVLFLCTLPSTVQSSIALTSIADGNVAGAVCSATASNLVGMILTPILFAGMTFANGGRAGITAGNATQVLLELLLPFAAGHLLRPWIGNWAERSRRILAVTDRVSILLVVYTAFSAAIVQRVWRALPAHTIATVTCLTILLLGAGLLVAVLAPRAIGLAKRDGIAVVFCASQKSIVSGVPIASALFPASQVGPALIPLMIYYPIQLLLCAWLARRYARTPSTEPPTRSPIWPACRSDRATKDAMTATPS